MSANLLSMLQGALGSGAADQIGKALGEDPAKIKNAMSGALPSILGGLMNSASTPDGLKNLTNAVDQADGGMLDNLGGMLGGGGVQDIIKKGSSMLPNILGGNLTGGIADAITKSSGLGRNSVMSLLGMLLPIVLGFLSKTKKSMGLDMGGLGSLLAGQKGFLQGMLPAGLGSVLKMGDLGKAASAALGGAAQQATGAANYAAGAANYAAGQASAAGGGLAKVLIPVLVIAAVGYAAYSFLGKGSGSLDIQNAANKAGAALNDSAKAAADSTKSTVDAAKDLVDSGMKKLTDGLPGTIDGLKDALAGIKDVESAKAALPKLKDASSAIESLSKGMSGLPESLKKTVGDQVKNFLPTIEGKAKELLANEGIAAQIKSVLEGLIAKLKSIIGQ